MERAILHSDLNCFYASVETVLNPEYVGRAIAVCGSTEERHGIVLAKSEKAKRAGVKTGMINSEAKALCPELIIVPPHFEKYLEFSRLVREIYGEYTDMIEPFGLDECWLDVTGSRGLFGNGEDIAEDIRNKVKQRLGLTVSVGVSFCKSFAKLGSDMKKPDAITVISRENFRSKIWGLPADELLFVGRSTYKRLSSCGICTIGDMARLKRDVMVRLFGVRGGYLWDYANGLDSSPVMHKEFSFPIKSVGHGITCREDLVDFTEIRRVFLELARDVGHKLRAHKKLARGVSIAVKNSSLGVRMNQCRLETPTRNPIDIAYRACELFASVHTKFFPPVRALTVTAIDLCEEEQGFQTDLFFDYAKGKRRDTLCDTVDDINTRYGTKTLYPLSVKELKKLPAETSHETTLPAGYVI